MPNYNKIRRTKKISIFYISRPAPFVPFLHYPSHSCEGRNLRRRIAAGNCTLLQFAPSARRFLPSQEWDVSLIFAESFAYGISADSGGGR
ncbi:MAG: hypothetical protein ACR2QC_12570 [Gammaproteobacteria bacterium]